MSRGWGDWILERIGIWGSYPGYEGFVSGVKLLESGNEDGGISGCFRRGFVGFGDSYSFSEKMRETNGILAVCVAALDGHEPGDGMDGAEQGLGGNGRVFKHGVEAESEEGYFRLEAGVFVDAFQVLLLFGG